MMEGFIKVFQKLDQYGKKNESTLYTWIKSIMVNQSIDYFRAHKRRYEAEVPMEVETISPYTDDLDTRLKAEHLLRLMDEMPEKQRIVFNLREVEGYEFEEIAEMVQEPVNTVRVHLFRGRQWLQKRIKEEDL